MNENARSALEFLHMQYSGVLSTHSTEVEGYPFGSLTPYCLDSGFNPVIFISDLAQHTKNIKANPKVCLTITEETDDNEKQAHARYTYIGDAIRVAEGSGSYEEVADRYFRYFPSSRGYLETHDFNFYRIHLVRGRYIDGFGKIFWITQSEWQHSNVFSSTEELAIVNHMNSEHPDSLRNYCSHYKNLEVHEDEPIVMTGIYQYGFDVIWKGHKLHFPVKEEIFDVLSARERLVEMSKASRE
ncbi:MAG: DUF2470 domain-containing protein [bacterium]|nr:DUF2470 domain-containing protein [bacterium]